jgi:hypothetical protein
MADVRLTKLDVARRQLQTALRLYFSHGDLVSAWTLGAAAYNVLRDLSQSKGLPPMMLKGQFPASLPQAVRKALVDRIQAVENFLKHADLDPDAELLFQPDGQIELLLFDAALRLRDLSNKESTLMVLMQMWFLSRAAIQHDGDKDLEQWLRAVRPLGGETAAQYRTRMWDQAAREAHRRSSQ